MSEDVPPHDPLEGETTRLAESISDTLGPSATDGEHAALVGFVLVTEWMDLNGEKWINRNSGCPAGTLPRWTADGLLHYALHHMSDPAPAEDDEDD